MDSSQHQASEVWSTWVDLGERGYPVCVASGLIGRAGALIRGRLQGLRRCAVVTSEAIQGLHGDPLIDSLQESGLEAEVILVRDREEDKSWEKAGGLIGELLGQGLGRKSAVVAFGGGVIGDLAGFVSSIYLRGVALVQVPTTLLAQVDSGIGGKTAVNHPKGKNLIGSFHQPSLVISDTGLLSTLPGRELRSGLAEAVKYGVIADEGLFRGLEEEAGELLGADGEALTRVVRSCSAIKARLVGHDERDTEGIRAVLNYGHTVGHALETLSGLELRHGEAVAMGMHSAALISRGLGLLGEAEVGRQKALLERLGLETGLPSPDPGPLLEVMRRDKKAEGGSIRFVLPTGIGSRPELRAVPDHTITRILGGGGHA